MTVKPSGSNDGWDVEYVSEVSEKAPTRLAGAEANSGRVIAGDEKATSSRGLVNSIGWGVRTSIAVELSRRHSDGACIGQEVQDIDASELSANP